MKKTFIQERQAKYDELIQIDTENGSVKIYAVDSEIGFPFSEYYTTVSEMGYKSVDEMIKTLKNKKTKKEINTDEQTAKEISGLVNLAKHRAKNGGNVSMRLKDGTLYNDIVERLKEYGLNENEAMEKLENIQYARSI